MLLDKVLLKEYEIRYKKYNGNKILVCGAIFHASECDPEKLALIEKEVTKGNMKKLYLRKRQGGLVSYYQLSKKGVTEIGILFL